MIPEPVLNCHSSSPVRGVDRLEPALHRSVEDDVAGGGERAAPDREVLLDRPGRLARCRTSQAVNSPRLPPGPGSCCTFGADVRRAGDVVRLDALAVHAQVLVRDVEQPGPRREGRRLPVLGARRRSGRCRARPCPTCGFLSGRRIAAGRSSGRRPWSTLIVAERLGRQHLAGRAVDHVDVAVALGVDEHLARLPVPSAGRAGCSR